MEEEGLAMEVDVSEYNNDIAFLCSYEFMNEKESFQKETSLILNQ